MGYLTINAFLFCSISVIFPSRKVVFMKHIYIISNPFLSLRNSFGMVSYFLSNEIIPWNQGLFD